MLNRRKIASELMDWVKSIIIALLFVAPVYFLATPTLVEGKSMQPTLQNRDLLISERISVLTRSFYHGEIVTFDARPKGQDIYIKRIIGLPGDIVEIRDGFVYVNGQRLEENYLSQGTYTDGNLKIKVPAGEIFVLGDHRDVSEDSRYLGCIKVSKVLTHPVFRVYPFNSAEKLN